MQWLHRAIKLTNAHSWPTVQPIKSIVFLLKLTQSRLLWILLWHNHRFSCFAWSSAFSFACSAVFAFVRLRSGVATLKGRLGLVPVMYRYISILINIVDYLLVVLLKLLDIITNSSVQPLFNTWSYTIHVFQQALIIRILHPKLKIRHRHLIALSLNTRTKVIPGTCLLRINR